LSNYLINCDFNEDHIYYIILFVSFPFVMFFFLV
jgi:hypothetical protein